MGTRMMVVFVLGVCTALLAVLVFRPAPPLFADTSSAVGFVGVAGNAQPGARDVLWLMDVRTDTPRLCIYELREGRLALIASRNIKYDFMYDEFPRGQHTPPVDAVFKDTEKQREAQRKPPPKPGG